MSRKTFVNIISWVILTMITLSTIQYAFNKGYLEIVFASIFIYVVAVIASIFWRLK